MNKKMKSKRDDAVERVARLRKHAIKVIGTSSAAKKLPEILKKVDDPRLLDSPSSDQDQCDTLLEWAVQEGDIDSVRILLESGADPMQCGESGVRSTHLLGSAPWGMKEETMRGIVTLLKDAGADFDVKDARGWTVLHHAIWNGAPDYCRTLIDCGVRIDPRLLNDRATESEIVPDSAGQYQPEADEALRTVRSIVLGQSLMSAMPSEGEPLAKPLIGMTL